jgi:hypothetical protein
MMFQCLRYLAATNLAALGFLYIKPAKRIEDNNDSTLLSLPIPILHLLSVIMFSLGLSKFFSKVLVPRGQYLDSVSTRSSLPDSFDVGLAHDWSEDSSTTNSNKWYSTTYYSS